MSTRRSGLKVSFLAIIFMSIIVFTAVLVGGAVGGVAGYMIALNAEPDVIAIPEAAPVTFVRDISPPVLQDVAANSESGTPPHNSNNNTVHAESDSLISAVDTVMPATVTVLNFTQRGSSSGSGVIIDAKGYIVTNNHVVQGARALEVLFSHGGRVEAQLVGQAPAFDLAVIKIDAEQVPAIATFGDSSALRQGERVAAIGSALGNFQNTVTSGVVSGHNRSLGGQRGLLQTDTPINHGNSGGPLINLQGEVVGINVMVLRGNGFGGDVAEGLGFSIPSNTAKTVVRQLIQTGEAEMPFLGISYSDLNPQLSIEKGVSLINGAFIEQVIRGTAAANAGLQAGDIVWAIDGQQINDQYPLAQVLLGYSVGEEITLTVVRDGRQFDMDVTLKKRPSNY